MNGILKYIVLISGSRQSCGCNVQGQNTYGAFGVHMCMMSWIIHIWYDMSFTFRYEYKKKSKDVLVMLTNWRQFCLSAGPAQVYVMFLACEAAVLPPGMKRL